MDPCTLEATPEQKLNTNKQKETGREREREREISYLYLCTEQNEKLRILRLTINFTLYPQKIFITKISCNILPGLTGSSHFSLSEGSKLEKIPFLGGYIPEIKKRNCCLAIEMFCFTFSFLSHYYHPTQNWESSKQRSIKKLVQPFWGLALITS